MPPCQSQANQKAIVEADNLSSHQAALVLVMAAAPAPRGVPAAPAPRAVPAAAAPPPQADENTRILNSKRGGEKLVHDGFLYNLRRNHQDGGKVWICDRSGKDNCPASCKSTAGLRGLSVEVATSHNHLANPERIQREDLRNSLKVAAKAQPTAKAAVLVATGLREVPPEDMPHIPNNTELKRLVWDV